MPRIVPGSDVTIMKIVDHMMMVSTIEVTVLTGGHMINIGVVIGTLENITLPRVVLAGNRTSLVVLVVESISKVVKIGIGTGYKDDNYGHLQGKGKAQGHVMIPIGKVLHQVQKEEVMKESTTEVHPQQGLFNRKRKIHHHKWRHCYYVF